MLSVTEFSCFLSQQLIVCHILSYGNLISSLWFNLFHVIFYGCQLTAIPSQLTLRLQDFAQLLPGRFPDESHHPAKSWALAGQGLSLRGLCSLRFSHHRCLGRRKRWEVIKGLLQKQENGEVVDVFVYFYWIKITKNTKTGKSQDIFRFSDVDRSCCLVKTRAKTFTQNGYIDFELTFIPYHDHPCHIHHLHMLQVMICCTCADII